MNLFALLLFIAVLPLVSQFVVGSMSLCNRVKIAFEYVTLFNTIALFVMIYVGLQIVNHDAQNQNVRCGMPGATFFFFGLILLVVFLFTVVIQLIVKSKKKKHS